MSLKERVIKTRTTGNHPTWLKFDLMFSSIMNNNLTWSWKYFFFNTLYKNCGALCVATAFMPQGSILLVICSNNNNYYCLSASFQMTRHTIATCIHFVSDISDTPLSKYVTTCTWLWLQTSCKSWINISGFSLKIGVAGEYYKVKSNRWITTEG